MSDYEKGCEDTRKRILEEMGKVQYQTGTQRDMYSEWVYEDRRAYDVLQDCIRIAERR